MCGDSRAREICEYLNFPYHPELSDCVDFSKIYSSCDYSKLNLDYNSRLNDYIQFQKKNKVNYNPLKIHTTV